MSISDSSQASTEVLHEELSRIETERMGQNAEETKGKKKWIVV
jgi:hypothetical protein